MNMNLNSIPYSKKSSSFLHCFAGSNTWPKMADPMLVASNIAQNREFVIIV